jgi:hypothetical protein
MPPAFVYTLNHIWLDWAGDPGQERDKSSSSLHTKGKPILQATVQLRMRSSQDILATNVARRTEALLATSKAIPKPLEVVSYLVLNLLL